MTKSSAKDLPDPYEDILGVNFAPDRLKENLETFKDILEAIEKLRGLDLTEVHPAVVFDPFAGYPDEPGE